MPVTAAIAATTTAIPSHAIQFMVALLQDASQLSGCHSLKSPTSLDRQLLRSANCRTTSNRMLIHGHELSSECRVRASRSNRNVGDNRLGNWPPRSPSPRPRIRRREMAEDEGYAYRPAGRWY